MNEATNDIESWRDRALRLEASANRIMVAQERAMRRLLIATFARGHVLLEGDVGVGKTTLLQTLARGIGGAFERIEGTVDLMPNDLLYHTYLTRDGRPRIEAGTAAQARPRALRVLLQRDQPGPPPGPLAHASGDGRAQRERLQRGAPLPSLAGLRGPEPGRAGGDLRDPGRGA